MSAKLSPLPGGFRLDGHKGLSNAAPLQTAALPKTLVLPLHQHIGVPAEPLVKVGERVLKGQMIAAAQGYVSVPVHASSSGRVAAIEDRPVPHPSGLSAPCIVIEVDGDDEEVEYQAEQDYFRVDNGHLRNVIRHAGIVGLGGAGFPTFIKMNPGPSAGIRLVILNGAECEPYITCDDRLMRERAAEIAAGGRIIQHLVHAERCVIGVEDNKPEAIAALRAAVPEGMEVRAVPTVYPMGGEKQLVYALTGEEVPRDGIPAEIGVVTQNVATAAAIYQAVTHGRPLLSRVITVTGSGVARPGNYEVRLGTPIRDLLAACGGPDDDTVAVIMGGSMMGFPIRDVQAPVIKTTNCLIAAHAAEVGAEPRAMPCIRCGACQTACPVDLLPQQLYWYARAKDMVRVQEYNLFDCIECGCCAYVCPSRIPLVSFYRYAKTEIAAQERDRQRADVARRRHAQHDQRIAREKAEREARRLEKKAALDTAGQGKTGSAAVDQAVARKQQGAVSAPGGDQE